MSEVEPVNTFNPRLFDREVVELANGHQIFVDRSLEDGLFSPTSRLDYPYTDINSLYVAREIGPCGGVQAATLGAEVLAGIDRSRQVKVNVRITNGADSHKRLSELGVIMGVAPEDVGAHEIYAVGAHGNERDYSTARSNGAETYDLTCIYVDSTHKEVEEVAKQDALDGLNTAVIYLSLGGRADHAEFIGTMNRAEDLGVTFHPIFSEEDVERLFDESSSQALLKQDWQRIRIISQTTNDSDDAEKTADTILDRIRSHHDLASAIDTLVFPYNRDNVCRTVMLRQKAARQMVDLHEVDTLIVLGSSKSKNTRNLAKVALAEASSIVDGGRLTRLARIILINSHLDLPEGVGESVGIVSGASVDSENIQWLLDTIDPENRRIYVGDSDRERLGKVVFPLAKRNRDTQRQAFLNLRIRELAKQRGIT